MLLQEDLMEMLPAVEEANSISEELDKKKKFELMLVSPEARGQLKGRTEVCNISVDPFLCDHRDNRSSSLKRPP